MFLSAAFAFVLLNCLYLDPLGFFPSYFLPPHPRLPEEGSNGATSRHLVSNQGLHTAMYEKLFGKHIYTTSGNKKETTVWQPPPPLSDLSVCKQSTDASPCLTRAVRWVLHGIHLPLLTESSTSYPCLLRKGLKFPFTRRKVPSLANQNAQKGDGNCTTTSEKRLVENSVKLYH